MNTDIYADMLETTGDMVCRVPVRTARTRHTDGKLGAYLVVRDRLETLGHPVDTYTVTRHGDTYTVHAIRTGE